MRDHKKLEAFHSLDQLSGELYGAVRHLPGPDRQLMGEPLQRSIVDSTASLIHGCSTRNAVTFTPFVAQAHGFIEELGQHLRQCQRNKLFSERDCEFFIRRQQSCALQLRRLLKRQIARADEQREKGRHSEWEWEVECERENEAPAPKRHPYNRRRMDRQNLVQS